MADVKVKNPSGRIVDVADSTQEAKWAAAGVNGWSLAATATPAESADEGEASASPEPVAPRRKRGRPRKHVEEAAE